MIVNSKRSPYMSLYYIGALIIKEIKNRNYKITSIYQKIVSMNNCNLSIDYFYLAIDWLFLIDKIELNGENIKLK